MDLPHPEIEPMSLKSPALVGRFFTTSTNHSVVVLILAPLALTEGLYSNAYYTQLSRTGTSLMAFVFPVPSTISMESALNACLLNENIK